jgi:hypothetical protein
MIWLVIYLNEENIMSKDLQCVPGNVTLRCGGATTIRVKTLDGAEGVTIKALGYDSTVVTLNPTEGTTNKDGYLEVTVTCAQPGGCPGETTVTYDATGYDNDTLNINCKKINVAAITTVKVALMEVPIKLLPKLLSEQLFTSRISTTKVKQKIEK